MIALTELFIHDAHEPFMTAASDILRKPACLSRQKAPHPYGRGRNLPAGKR